LKFADAGGEIPQQSWPNSMSLITSASSAPFPPASTITRPSLLPEMLMKNSAALAS
jgi:hypothetical protein